jgi:tetratricopeptide (TPR) repeat protein
VVGHLKHLVYFENLAEVETDSPEWNAVTAGLVVLRLMDTWIDLGSMTLRENAKGVQNVRESVMLVDENDPVRDTLLNLLRAVEVSRHPDMSRVLPALAGYGQELESQGKWRLSVDVYENFIEFCDPDDHHALIDAHMRMARGFRMLGEWDDAADNYARAGQHAAAEGDQEWMLRVRIADAKLAIDRGNLSQAEALLDDCIGQAAGDNALVELRSLALHERGAAAFMSGRFQSAIAYLWDALQYMNGKPARYRALSDLASSFAELGHTGVTSDALSIVAAETQETHLRWVAQINLIGLSAMHGNQTEFESHVASLEGEQLPASLEANYHLQVGRGHHIRGDVNAARAALERAGQVATKNRFSHLEVEVQKAIGMVNKPWSPASENQPQQLPANVMEIAAALRRMRQDSSLRAREQQG